MMFAIFNKYIGKGPIMLDDLSCNGNETDIFECPSNGWFNHDCSHREYAGVSCSEYTFNIAYLCDNVAHI